MLSIELGRLNLWSNLMILPSLLLVGLSFFPLPLAEARVTNSDIVKIQTNNKHKVIIEIVKRFGIGNATIKRRGKVWPSQVTIIYRNFQALEKFEVSSGRDKLEASLHVVAGSTSCALSNGLVIGQSKRSISITLPKTFLSAAQSEIHLSWIDFYR